MRVLIIKTSSLGDVVHALPAVSDAVAAHPGIVFDWVVEEAFAEIPGWHPAVENVIPVAMRRWRKKPLEALRGIEWKAFKVQVRKHPYDLVIDAQGLLKSAMLTRLVKAPVTGMDWRSARESPASLFYQRRIPVPTELHAVERLRRLFAEALGYPQPDTPPDSGLDIRRFTISGKREPNIVFLHGTSRADKLWPESYWMTLAQRLDDAGYQVNLPWGNDEERARAERIAAMAPGARVLPRLNLHGIASVLAHADLVVAVDTGLAHLAAALNIPGICLYGPTDPALIGTCGEQQRHLRVPAFDRGRFKGIEPAAMAPLTPEEVWRNLCDMLPLEEPET